MDTELPKRLFEQGTEPQVEKINNCCRLSILKVLREQMLNEYNEVKKDPVFAQIIALHENSVNFSATLVHSFMCRQLLTAKKHELWFLFANRPLRFSLQEFYAVTGLKYEDDGNYEVEKWVDDGGFWSRLLKRGGNICMQEIRKQHIPNANKWSRVDRLRLVYLCVIGGVLMSKDEKVSISDKYIKLIMDFDKLRAYPWGLHSFDNLVDSIIASRVKLCRQKSYVLQGFPFAFQIWIMEAIPDIGNMLGRKLNDVAIVFPRCSNWRVSKSLGYEEIINLERLFGSEGVLYPFISSTGNMDVLLSANFTRDDEMRDERVDRLQALIRDANDWSDHVWEFEEQVVTIPPASEHKETEVENESSDNGDDYRTPCAEDTSASSSRRCKRKFADMGVEKRKQQLLTQRAAAKHGDDQDIKSFLRELILDMQAKNVSENDAKYGKLETEISLLKGEVKELKELLRQALSQNTIGEPSTSSKPTSVINPKPQGKEQKRDLSLDKLCEVNLTQCSEINMDSTTQMCLQKMMGHLSQATFVPGFDPPNESLEKDHDEWETPLTSLRHDTYSLTDKQARPMSQPGHNDFDEQLVFVSEEKWEELNQWIHSPINLQVGPSVLSPELSNRVVGPNKWLQNQEIDAIMYLFREQTTLRRWNPDRVGFMSYLFSLEIQRSHREWRANKKKFVIDQLLISYGKGELPSHGRTDKVWDVDIDRIYAPVCVNGNHWISVCISFVHRTVEVFDCAGMKRYKEVEAFAVMVPRIVKEIQTSNSKRHLTVGPYSVVYVPVDNNLNASGCDCGIYALKHIQCHLLGFNLSLVHDKNIKEARWRIASDLLQAAKDEVLMLRMSKYVPPKFAPSAIVDIS